MIGPRFTRRSWALVCVLAGLTLLAYSGAMQSASGGEIVLPLDDTYIHFQYARQLANGEPYVYTPGGEPTSGATSLLYPYVLATGYTLGFRGLDLGLWATGAGILALIASAWLVFQLVALRDRTGTYALLLALAFLLSGPFAWHAMSGMETSLVTAFTLLTLLMLLRDDLRGLGVSAALLATLRPEMGLFALLATAWTAWLHRREAHRLIWLILPLIAFAAQPLLNLALTGSVSASGSSAKSILSTIPFVWSDVVTRIADNFTRMWADFATGTNGSYLPLTVAPLALLGWLAMLRDRSTRGPALVLLTALLSISAAIATLDTAFWHFKRYQMPLMALFYPLAGWGLVAIHSTVVRRYGVQRGFLADYALAAVALLTLLLALPTWGEFMRLYRVNVANIAAQPLPMARWLNANTAPDALIAVHDVGMMAYIGQRATLDMVGLTTPGAADSWRSGPGAVAEFLMAHEPWPDYVAAYTTARGLNYLEATPLYGELLAGFTATYAPEDNVAVGAPFQGIYRVDLPAWTPPTAQLDSTPYYLVEHLDGLTLADSLNVADLDSEAAHDYTWSGTAEGFVTEVYSFPYAGCDDVSCQPVTDGGRRITGEETFTLAVEPGQDAILVTRVHPAQAGTLAIYANGEFLATRVIPAIPGRWLDLPTLIPAERITGDTLHVRIVPDVPGGVYMPYMHSLHQGIYGQPDFGGPVLNEGAAYQDGAFVLRVLSRIETDPDRLVLTAFYFTDGRATGDYRVFVHVYDDPEAPPVAQFDAYPGEGSLPPGNWLPGTLIESLAVDLRDLPPGNYRVAIGFYDPQTGERLLPEAIDGATTAIDTPGRRLFLNDVEIPSDGP